ncbi:MAG: DUF6429 family protein [Granulosicoccaceae bacterium]
MDKTAEIALAILALTQHTDQAGGVRAWKGIDWELLDAMRQKGWIGNPVGKAKSVSISKSGLSVAIEAQAKYLDTEPNVADIKSLEEGMWTYALRADSDWFDAHLHGKFVEVGRSGRRYSRDEFFPISVGLFEAKLPLPRYQVQRLGNGCALATYDSVVRYQSHVETAFRASTWIYEEGNWQLLYHQGTAQQDDA